ncbi:MAG: metallophosphoesterase family protein [Planctomycetota bacterium]
MKQIGLLADTHGHYDPRIEHFFAACDELWHVGDFGSIEIADRLAAFKPLRGVYGNIDGPEIRDRFPLDLRFACAGLDVWMTHIGGYPGRYDRRVRDRLRADPPGLFISGHSHILKVKPDKQLGLLHLNPGAAGNQGFHQLKTMMLLRIMDGAVHKLQAVDLGPRGAKLPKK